MINVQKILLLAPGFLKTLGLSLVMIIFFSCSEKGTFDMDNLKDGIQFGAFITGHDETETRANNNTYDITTEFYDCKYHVLVEGKDYNDEVRYETSRYVIPSGYSATILPDRDEKTLNWFSRTGEHDFWAWTMPHDLEFEANGSHEEIDLIFRDTDLDDCNSGTSGSTSSWKEGAWKNGKDLEQLIGAHSGTYIYNDQGMYVPLRFQHLVSKIIISKFYVVDNMNGTTEENLKGTITFYGMPRKTKLLTSPRDSEGRPQRPRIEIPEDWDYNPSVGVKYAICNSGLALKWEGYDPYYYASTMPRDCWYIPPEIDFSRLSFKIEIYEYNSAEMKWELSQTHGKHGAYYGDFKNVKFSRSTTGSGYDDTDNPGSDVNILHAGEYLTLTINLYEKGNPVLHGNIIDWTSSSSDREGSAHVEQGIYSVDEMRELASVMKGTDLDLKEQYFNLFGSGRTTADDPEDEYPDYEEIYGEELKIFELYDDIGTDSYSTSSSTSTKVSDLYMEDGYMLDGRGHTVNVNSTYVYVGNVRDVYLRYYYYNSSTKTYTEYVVYIDKMGYVWSVDPETYEMKPTDLNVNNPDYRYGALTLSDNPKLTFSETARY